MNIVIGYSWFKRLFDTSILRTLFFKKGERYDSKQIYFSRAKSIEELLVEIGAYKSRGEARRAGRAGAVPSGYTELQANKILKVYLYAI